MTTSTPEYPRPDFVRPSQNWSLLNSQTWNLLFDDGDVGLAEQWHIRGLPDKVDIAPSSFSLSEDEEAQRLVAFPELREKGFVKDEGVTHHLKKPITLPFTFQTAASGWELNEAHEVLWYETILKDFRGKEEIQRGDRALLRFGAVDYEATVWVNGNLVGQHRGGHVPFDVDMTDELAKQPADAEGRLILRVRDSPYDLSQPRGKQYWGPVPESIFYKPSSGIWQSVWAEVVPAARIADSSHGTVLRSDDIESGMLQATLVVLGRKSGVTYEVEVEAHFGGVLVGKSRECLAKDKDFAQLSLDLKLPDEKRKQLSAEITEKTPFDNARCWKDGLALWSVHYPSLYDLKLRLLDKTGRVLDEVHTYTGMRDINWTTGDGTFRLNGYPLFQSMVLDQGYWPSTGLTPPSSDALKLDIELCKKMGFNGCRKHQKVEDPRFLYWADKLGYLVWGEIANAYEFGDGYVDRFNHEWTEAVRRDINHPSIVVWTPVNESWAYPNLKESTEQRNHIRQLYYLTKTLDPSRPVNDNCGWEHVQTDLSTFHDYADAPQLRESCATLNGILGKKLADRDFFVQATESDSGTTHRQGAPVICSEFGGVNIAAAKDSEKGERDWGYTTAKDPADLLKRIDGIVMAVVDKGLVCGMVWTQLTDIEQEVNGLYTFDRQAKIEPAEVAGIVKKAENLYYGFIAENLGEL